MAKTIPKKGGPKKRPKDAQPQGPKKRERDNLSHGMVRTVGPYLVPMPKIVLLFKIQFCNKNSKLWNFQSDIKVICKIGQTQHQKTLFPQFLGISKMVQKHTCANRVPNSKIDQELA
jgi:hypothetical protein